MGELWRKDGPDPVTFGLKADAEAYSDTEMERLDLDRRESLVIRYLYRA